MRAAAGSEAEAGARRGTGSRSLSRMGPLLVTGFERFDVHRLNPSEEVVKALPAGGDLRTSVLPVAFRRAAALLEALLEEARPRAVLMLGLHAGPEIRLERLARNRDDADACDEDGERRPAAAISAAGPVTYPSTLPLDAFARALTDAGLPWTWSDDAGGFLCNHVFYRAREWVERLGLAIPCGFVHLPPFDALPFERQVRAVTACVDRLGR